MRSLLACRRGAGLLRGARGGRHPADRPGERGGDDAASRTTSRGCIGRVGDGFARARTRAAGGSRAVGLDGTVDARAGAQPGASRSDPAGTVISSARRGLRAARARRAAWSGAYRRAGPFFFEPRGRVVGRRGRGSRWPRRRRAAGGRHRRPARRCAGRGTSTGRLSAAGVHAGRLGAGLRATTSSVAADRPRDRRRRRALAQAGVRGVVERGRADRAHPRRRRIVVLGVRRRARGPSTPRTRRAGARTACVLAFASEREPGRLLLSARRRGRRRARRVAADAGRAVHARARGGSPGPPTGASPWIASADFSAREQAREAASVAEAGRERLLHAHQRGGNAAIRRVLLRVARSLKAGAEREPVLARMRRDMAPVQDRYDEIEDSIVRDAIARGARPMAARRRLRALSRPPTSSCAEVARQLARVRAAAGEVRRAGAGGERERVVDLLARAERVGKPAGERVAGAVVVDERAGQLGGLEAAACAARPPARSRPPCRRSVTISRRDVERSGSTCSSRSLPLTRRARRLRMPCRAISTARGVATSRRARARRAGAIAAWSPPETKTASAPSSRPTGGRRRVRRVALADDRDRPLAVVGEVDEAPALHRLARAAWTRTPSSVSRSSARPRSSCRAR